MKSSPWQTVILAVIGALLPYGTAIINGGEVSAKVVIASVVTAALLALANILRSPMQNPPTPMPAPPPK